MLLTVSHCVIWYSLSLSLSLSLSIHCAVIVYITWSSAGHLVIVVPVHSTNTHYLGEVEILTWNIQKNNQNLHVCVYFETVRYDLILSYYNHTVFSIIQTEVL